MTNKSKPTRLDIVSATQHRASPERRRLARKNLDEVMDFMLESSDEEFAQWIRRLRGLPCQDQPSGAQRQHVDLLCTVCGTASCWSAYLAWEKDAGYVRSADGLQIVGFDRKR